MKRYTINCHYDMVVAVEVFAENEEQAKELARERADRMDLQHQGECMGYQACVTDCEEVADNVLRQKEREAVKEAVEQEIKYMSEKDWLKQDLANIAYRGDVINWALCATSVPKGTEWTRWLQQMFREIARGERKDTELYNRYARMVARHEFDTHYKHFAKSLYAADCEGTDKLQKKQAVIDGVRCLCDKKEEKERAKAIREAEKAAKIKETYKTGLLVTDTKFGLNYEHITGIEEGMNTYIVTTATKIQVECMKHYRVMEKAKNEHTVADLPEWVRPGAVLMINGTWKWEEVEIVELADGCVWYKKGNSVMGWTYDHFISLYVNHRYAKVKEYAPEPTLEDIGKFRAVCEAEGCTYPGNVEGTREYYRDTLLTAEDGKTVSYQFGNCRFDCKRNESGTWDVHAYDTDGEDTTFEGRTASFFGGMFNDLFKTWGSGNLPELPAEVCIDAA